ncbi:MAG TPA: universal stress protein [Mucilaginibacter sp.]|jgi:nucleotide-binding universal stress UspA family protein|nr:universal stress protein [Mucilaginibacter sp.]
MKINKILIVADDSPSSIKAVQYGFNLAYDLGAKVMLLNVIEPELAAGNPDAGIFPDDALVAIKSKTEDFQMRMQLNYARSTGTELRICVGGVLLTIIKTINEWQADLVVAGTHVHTGLNKLFSGSIAESIIHHSPIPVCIVPGDAKSG